MSAYQIGEIYTVKIKEVKPYAAFIVFDDGTLGMLHISEISDKFINDIERFVSSGDSISVKLLEIDPKNFTSFSKMYFFAFLLILGNNGPSPAIMQIKSSLFSLNFFIIFIRIWDKIIPCKSFC